MNRFFTVFFVLLSLTLFADQLPNSTQSEIAESAPAPLATIYGIPDTNILGVNVINGDYNYSSIDFDLPGADPLVFQRIYCSSQNKLRSFFHGWTQNLSSLVRTTDAKESPDSPRESFHVILSGSLTGEIPFKTECENRWADLKVNRDIFKKGVTNCGKGRISGRTNIKNMKVNYSEKEVKVTNPDGTEHLHRPCVYRNRKAQHHSENELVETIKPNGVKVEYNHLSRILLEVKSLTQNDGISNRIEFDCPNYQAFLQDKKTQFHRFSINASSKDGKTAKYSFRCSKKDVRLSNHEKKTGFIISMSAFESSHLPSEHYCYFERHDGHELLTSRHGTHHKTTVDYFQKGDKVELYGYAAEDVSSTHISRHRVKQINVAVNGPEDLQTAFRFAYHKDKKTKDAFTDVYDGRNQLTRYHYSTKNFRLNCVEKYAGTSEHSIYRRDRLEYGAKRTALEGDLLYKTVESADGTVHYGENYDYDERGNILKRKLHYRTFTGSKAHAISTKQNPFSKGNQRLKGGEIKSTFYTYNELNLPTSEDDGRLKTLLTYHSRNGKMTNLPASKLIQQGQKIRRREFFEFDGNAGCTLRIEDDGSASSSDDLTGVNSRKVVRMMNRKCCFAGLPLEIDVWGSNGQEEQRISRTTLKYDSHGYVENETYFDANNAFAFELHKVRDLQGNIVSETDALGQTTDRQYNAYGCLLEEYGPSSNYHMEYTYDWLQRPITATRKCADGIHLTTVSRYDLEGKLTKIEDAYGFATEFVYNEQGRPIEIIHPPIRTENGWVRPREKKQYNFLRHLISETDAKGAVTLYTPNDAGLPLKISFPDGTFEKFSYSIYGEMLEKIQRNGSKVVYAYDEFSRPTSEEIYDRDGNFLKKCSKKYAGLLLLSEKDGEGVKKCYAYDYAGRVSEVRQGNMLTKFAYDSLGRVTEEKRYFGENESDYIATCFMYDLLNRVINKKEIDGNGQVHSEVQTAYDPDGNVITSTTWTQAGVATTTNTYDPRGNLSSVTDPLGNTTYYHHRYDYFFDGYNLPCLVVIDPAGVKTTTISDAHGAVILVQVHSPFGQLLSDAEMFYDLQGNLVRKEQHLPNENIVTLYEYDSTSRLIRQVNGAGNAEQITTTFVYNHFGELSETHYADGTSKHRTYDGIGRLLEELSDDKSVHYAYSYNKQDLLTKALNCNTKKETVRRYSQEGNLLSERFENGLKIAYKYDYINRVTECIYPDRSSVKQTYNPAYLTKAERIKDGSVIYAASFSDFDQSGKPHNITFPKKSGNLSLKYDQLNRPIEISFPHYKEKKISYDNRGLLTSKIVNKDLQTFSHDSLQQLTLEKTKEYSHTYENDALHRQISVDGCAQTHNAVHQLTQGVNDTYNYDAKGRRTQDSTTHYTYDRFDRLIKIEQDGSIWEYTYDAFNRKMSRTVNGTTTYYLYDGHEDIGSFTSKRKCIDLKVLSAKEGSIPIAIELADRNYSPLISSQGHITGLVKMSTGKLADYSPLTLFGKDLSEKPLSPWRFCGKRHEDASLGLIDFGFRFYHTKSAQWLTQDPLGESDGPNLYAYVKNNPGSFVDRFGLYGEGWSIGGAWDAVKDACNYCWDSIKDICSQDNPNDQCSWVDNQTIDFKDSSSFLYDNKNEVGSMVLDCSPVIGTCKSIVELYRGEDLITGEKTERWILAMGLIPGGKYLAKGGLKLVNCKLLDKIIEGGSRVVKHLKKEVKFRSFTEANFRENLKRSTKMSPPADVHAHHVFPKELAAEFAERGIKVHDPKYGIWWEMNPHLEAHGKFKYNEYWNKLIRQKPPLEKEEFYDHGRNLMKGYGKDVNF